MKQPSFTIKGKVIICGALGLLIVLFAIVGQQIAASRSSQTIKVGKAVISQDPRAYPDYKVSNGDRVTIPEKNLLEGKMTTVAISQLEKNLKLMLYNKTGEIASIASIVDKVKFSNDGTVVFQVKIDTDQRTYNVVATDGGAVTSVDAK